MVVVVGAGLIGIRGIASSSSSPGKPGRSSQKNSASAKNANELVVNWNTRVFNRARSVKAAALTFARGKFGWARYSHVANVIRKPGDEVSKATVLIECLTFYLRK